MFNVYQLTDALTPNPLVVVSDEDWRSLSTEQKVQYRFYRGGFLTGLEAIIHMLELSEGDRSFNVLRELHGKTASLNA